MFMIVKLFFFIIAFFFLMTIFTGLSVFFRIRNHLHNSFARPSDAPPPPPPGTGDIIEGEFQVINEHEK